jgi:Ca2+/Na+ antiporter
MKNFVKNFFITHRIRDLVFNDLVVTVVFLFLVYYLPYPLPIVGSVWFLLLCIWVLFIPTSVGLYIYGLYSHRKSSTK